VGDVRLGWHAAAVEAGGDGGARGRLAARSDMAAWRAAKRSVTGRKGRRRAERGARLQRSRRRLWRAGAAAGGAWAARGGRPRKGRGREKGAENGANANRHGGRRACPRCGTAGATRACTGRRGRRRAAVGWKEWRPAVAGRAHGRAPLSCPLNTAEPRRARARTLAAAPVRSRGRKARLAAALADAGVWASRVGRRGGAGARAGGERARQQGTGRRGAAGAR
jgi:hypothetical protein